MAIIIGKRTNLDAPIKVESLNGVTFTTESEAHQFVVRCEQKGQELTLSGTISAKFVRADGNTVQLVGSIVDGAAVVTLAQDCYNVQGRFQLAIFNTVGDTKLCIYACVGTVQKAQSGNLIDGGSIIPDVEDLIADIQAARETIPPTYDTLLASIAGTYSATKTYAVGDYVWYDGSLYRCTTAITTAEAWTSGHWTAAVLGNDVADLKNAIIQSNMYGLGIEQGYWAVADGSAVSSATWCRTKTYAPKEIIVSTTFYMFLMAYENDVYVGTWNGSEFSTTYNESSGANKINVHDFSELYQGYSFKLSFRATGGATVIPSDVVSSLGIEYFDDIIGKDFDVLNKNTSSNGIVQNIFKFDKSVINKTVNGLSITVVNKNTILLNGTPSSDILLNLNFYEISIPDSKMLYYRVVCNDNTISGKVRLRVNAFTVGGTIESDIANIETFNKLVAVKYPSTAVSSRDWFGIDAGTYANVSVTFEVFEESLTLGEKVESVSEKVYKVKYINDYIRGAFRRDGGFDTTTMTLFTTSEWVDSGYDTIKIADGYSGIIFAFDDDDEYYGGNDSDYTLTGGYYSGTFYFTNRINIGFFQKAYPNLKYKLCIKRNDGANIYLNEVLDSVSLYKEVSASGDDVSEKIDGIVQSGGVGFGKSNFIISIGHRGGNADFPENTLPNFLQAVREGLEYVEVDVAYTSDNVPVLCHDLTINRVARNADGSELSSTVYISNITYEQALEYDFGIYKGQQFAGTKIMRFDDFIELCKKLSLTPLIELKRESINDPDIHTQTRVNQLIDIVHKNNMKTHVMWCSFDTISMGRVLNTDKNASVGIAISRAEVTNTKSLELKIGALKALRNGTNFVFATLGTAYATSDIYGTLADNNIPCVEWYINSNADAISISDHVTTFGGMTDYALNIGDVIKNSLIT